MNKQIIDLTGLAFGKLTVVSLAESKKLGAKRRTVWFCDCLCGNKNVKILASNLKSGKTKSCGCLAINNLDNVTHGLSGSLIYKVYYTMRHRCYNSKNSQYENYGGRGIIVCQEWLNDFTVFYDWAMKNGYKKGLEIDRENTNGNYEPSNCRFVTSQINNVNRRVVKTFIYNGESLTLPELAMKVSMKYVTLHARLAKFKGDLGKALQKKSTVC